MMFENSSGGSNTVGDVDNESGSGYWKLEVVVGWLEVGK